MGFMLSKTILLAAGSAALALSAQAADPAAASAAEDIPAARIDPERWPEVAFPTVLTEAGEARVQAILARMTLEQKVGQIIQADIKLWPPQ